MSWRTITAWLLMAVGVSIALAGALSPAYWFVIFVVCLIVTATGSLILLHRYHRRLQ